MSASSTLVSAVVTHLKNASQVQTYLGSKPCIFDTPDSSATLPYIVVSDAQETVQTSHTETISIHTIQVFVYANSQSLNTLRNIVDAAISAISSCALTLTAHNVSNIAVEKISYTQQDRNRTNTATISYRVVTEPIG